MASKASDSRNTGMRVLLILLILAMIAATVFVIRLCINIPNQTACFLRPQKLPRRLPQKPPCRNRSTWCPLLSSVPWVTC